MAGNVRNFHAHPASLPARTSRSREASSRPASSGQPQRTRNPQDCRKVRQITRAIAPLHRNDRRPHTSASADRRSTAPNSRSHPQMTRSPAWRTCGAGCAGRASPAEPPARLVPLSNVIRQDYSKPRPDGQSRLLGVPELPQPERNAKLMSADCLTEQSYRPQPPQRPVLTGAAPPDMISPRLAKSSRVAAVLLGGGDERPGDIESRPATRG